MPSDGDSVATVSVACSAISFTAELFIILTYLLHPVLHKLRYSLVFYLSLADIIRSFAKIWGNLETGTFGCGLQAFLITYGGLSTFFWITVIAVVLYALIFYADIIDVTPQSVKKRKQQMLVLCYGLPFTLALLPLTTDSYGNVTGWCWIQQDSHELGVVWRWAIYYGWLLLASFLIIGIYVRLYVKNKQYLTANFGANNEPSVSGDEQAAAGDAADGADGGIARQDSDCNDAAAGAQDAQDAENGRAGAAAAAGAGKESDASANARMKLFARVKYYPLASILGFGFALINRLVELVGGSSPLWLKICHSAFTGLYGFFCAVIYGFTPKIVAIYKNHYTELKNKYLNSKETKDTNETKEEKEKETKDVEQNDEKPAAAESA